MLSKQQLANSKPQISRRSFVQGVVTLIAAPVVSSGVLSACQQNRTTPLPSGNTLDEALDRLVANGTFRGSTHVPMVAETLVTLGRTDVVLTWVEHFKNDAGIGDNDFTRSGEITRQNWREALGRNSRRADWVDFFAREIAATSWKAVLAEWSSLLASGVAAAAAHGLIRTAHAVRSLEAKASAQRRRELSEGLGLWASWYQPLPESVAKAEGRLKPSEAILQVSTMPPELVRRGNIVKALSSLEDFPSFAGVINLVDASGDASSFLADLTETFAGIFLANAGTFGSAIALVHAVTGPSAVRILLPYVNAEAKSSLLQHAWQIAAGIYSTNGRTTSPKLPEAKVPDKEDLIDRALKNANAHPIKFTEACLREYKINPKPVYLHAAQHAIENLRG